MSMSEYPNVGSQQSQNSQLNTPPTFPQQPTAPAAAGSASQMAVAGSANDDCMGEASSTVDHAAILDLDASPTEEHKPSGGSGIGLSLFMSNYEHFLRR